MNIQRATEEHIDDLNRLLRQVLSVHHKGRPDLFLPDAKKYTDCELKELLSDDLRPVFAAFGDKGEMLGYCFCIIKQHKNHNILTDVKTLYIDDLCVDESCRGQHIGKRLLEHVFCYAKSIGCYNVTLNVWAFNESAKKFYEACGFKPQKYEMETIL